MGSSIGPVNGNASLSEDASNLSNKEGKRERFSVNGDVTPGKKNPAVFPNVDEAGTSNKDVSTVSSGEEERNEDRREKSDVILKGAKANQRGMSLKEKMSIHSDKFIEHRYLVVEHNHANALSGLALTVRLALKYGKLLKVGRQHRRFERYYVKFMEAASALKMVEDISFLVNEHDLQASYIAGREESSILQANDSDPVCCFAEYLDFHDLFIEDKYKSKGGIFCKNFTVLDILWRGYWEVKRSFSHVTPADFLDGLLLIDLPPTRNVCEHTVTFLRLRCYEMACPRLQCTEFSSNLLHFVIQLNAAAIKAKERTIENRTGDVLENPKKDLKGENCIEILGSKSLLLPQLLYLALQHGNVVKMKKLPNVDKLVVRILFDDPDSHKKMALAFGHESLQDEKKQLEIAVQRQGLSAMNCGLSTTVFFDNLKTFNNIYLASEYVAFWNEIHKMGVKEWDDDADEVVHDYFLSYIQLKFFFINITASQFLKRLSITKEAFSKETGEPLMLQFQLYENIALNLVGEEGVQKLNLEAIKSLNDPNYTPESLKPIKIATHVPTARASRCAIKKYASLVGKLRKIKLTLKESEEKKEDPSSENSEAKTAHKKEQKVNKQGSVQTGTGQENSQKSEKSEAKTAPKKKKKGSKGIVQAGTGRGNSQYNFKDSRDAQFQCVIGKNTQLNLPLFQSHFDLEDSWNVYGRVGPQVVPEMNSQLGGRNRGTWDRVTGNTGTSNMRNNCIDSLKNSIDQYYVGSGTRTNKSAPSGTKQRKF